MKCGGYVIRNDTRSYLFHYEKKKQMGCPLLLFFFYSARILYATPSPPIICSLPFFFLFFTRQKKREGHSFKENKNKKKMGCLFSHQATQFHKIGSNGDHKGKNPADPSTPSSFTSRSGQSSTADYATFYVQLSDAMTERSRLVQNVQELSLGKSPSQKSSLALIAQQLKLADAKVRALESTISDCMTQTALTFHANLNSQRRIAHSNHQTATLIDQVEEDQDEVHAASNELSGAVTVIGSLSSSAAGDSTDVVQWALQYAKNETQEIVPSPSPPDHSDTLLSFPRAPTGPLVKKGIPETNPGKDGHATQSGSLASSIVTT